MVKRPVIAPGLQVHTRPDGHLQIGLTPRHRLRIADTAAVRRTLAALERGEAPGSDRESRRVLERLRPALRDGELLVQPGLPVAEVASVSLRHPETAQERLEARRRLRVRVLGDGGIDPVPLLRASGLPVATAEADVALVLGQGEIDRSLLDPMLRTLLPHLLLRQVEGEVVLGPFVIPGETACLRCLDAHLAADDPSYPLLVSGSVRLSAGSGVAEPVDSALTTIALGWAVRDLVRYAEGDPVSTRSATVRFAPDQASFAPEVWRQHPACGCGWGRAA